MKKIVEKMKNKIIKIEKLKDKTKNKYNDLIDLFCYFKKDFIENDYQNIKLNDIVIVFGLNNDDEFIAWDIKVIEKTETYITCMQSERHHLTIGNDTDCSTKTVYLTQKKYKKLAKELNIYHMDRQF